MPAGDPRPDARADDEVIGTFTSILQGVHIPCWILDDNGVFLWVNDAFVATLGDLRGAHYSALIAAESLETATRHFERGGKLGENDERSARSDRRDEPDVSTNCL